MLSSLPYEIVSKIYGYLSINEATSADIAYRKSNYCSRYSGYISDSHRIGPKAAKREMFRKVYEDRLSMRLYLGQHFSDCEGLLKCMLINDIYLSGSRALDYFVPGSTDENSDWDFYVDGKTDNAYRFMEFMKTVGTTWLTAIEWFSEKLENDEHESGITIKQIKTLEHMRKIGRYDDTVSRCIQELYTTFRNYRYIDEEEITITVTNSKGKEKKFIIRHDIYASFKIIYGKFQNHGKTQRIQLMVGTSGLETIMKFYTSALQCVITGFCASHMYANDAYKRKSRLWELHNDGTIARRKTADSQRKYEKRGFTFYRKSLTISEFPYKANTIVKRHLKDSCSHVIDYDIDGVYPFQPYHQHSSDLVRLMTKKRTRFYEFSWIESDLNLSVSTYHEEEKFQEGCRSIVDFVDELTQELDDAHISQILKDALQSRIASTIGNIDKLKPEETVIRTQSVMPKGYLDEFLKLNSS